MCFGTWDFRGSFFGLLLCNLVGFVIWGRSTDFRGLGAGFSRIRTFVLGVGFGFREGDWCGLWGCGVGGLRLCVNGKWGG